MRLNEASELVTQVDELLHDCPAELALPDYGPMLDLILSEYDIPSRTQIGFLVQQANIHVTQIGARELTTLKSQQTVAYVIAQNRADLFTAQKSEMHRGMGAASRDVFQTWGTGSQSTPPNTS